MRIVPDFKAHRALSRSGKKVLHIDKYPYYGSTEAAFSLREAEAWADELSRSRMIS
jgi:Rab proteins geranylgeranyltransferase component A